MRRIRIDLAYDGTDYHGWQVQPGLSTIQRTLEEILAGIEGRHVPVAGSGRTDAGVHALGQVAAFTIENPIPAANLLKAMNRLLPSDIRVLDAREMPLAFHPRFDAKAKTYEYRLYRGQVCSPFEHRYVYHYPYPLSIENMIQTAPLLEGEHDFTVFSARDEGDRAARSKVRTIWSSRVTCEGQRIQYCVRGSGFLKHMVRNIVGVLLEAGKGNLGPGDIERRLDPHCGIPAGPSVPARGLFLISVEY